MVCGQGIKNHSDLYAVYPFRIRLWHVPICGSHLAMGVDKPQYGTLFHFSMLFERSLRHFVVVLLNWRAFRLCDGFIQDFYGVGLLGYPCIRRMNFGLALFV